MFSFNWRKTCTWYTERRMEKWNRRTMHYKESVPPIYKTTMFYWKQHIITCHVCSLQALNVRVFRQDVHITYKYICSKFAEQPRSFRSSFTLAHSLSPRNSRTPSFHTDRSFTLWYRMSPSAGALSWVRNTSTISYTPREIDGNRVGKRGSRDPYYCRKGPDREVSLPSRACYKGLA